MRRSAAAIAFVIACTMLATSLPSYAATGLAWDQVTKFSMDGNVPDPNFPSDFQTASQPPPPQKNPGGMFGMNAMVNAAMGAMQMMKTGIAERHYIAGSLERTDNVGEQTATIVDCSARTITYLNLAKKTYHVVSMDQPQTPSSGTKPSPGQPQPVQDDGTRYKINYTSQALGAKQIDGQNTDGYKANMAVTVMKPNTDPQTMNTNLTEYVSSYAHPQQSCPVHLSTAGPGGSGPMAGMSSSMNMTSAINSAMHTPNGDPRFTVTSSGPPLPSGKLELFSVYQFSAQQSQGRAFATIIERGNVHPVSDSDKSIFGVPPDFTKES